MVVGFSRHSYSHHVIRVDDSRLILRLGAPLCFDFLTKNETCKPENTMRLLLKAIIAFVLASVAAASDVSHVVRPIVFH